MGKFIDLTGQRFGMLTVIRRGENHISPTNPKKPYVQWYCDCDCGNKDILIRGDSLKTGNTKSCGCYAKIFAYNVGKDNRLYNNYDLTGEYGIGWTTNTNKEFYFDLEDYDKIKDYTWYENDSDGYIRTSFENKKIYFHRIIMDVHEFEIQVDHVGGKLSRNDNRKCNLRLVTNSQNQMNRPLISTNTTGIAGVYWSSRLNKWVATIEANCKKHTLGSFNNLEDAEKARKEAEEKYFGEYSYDNSMEYAKQYAIN